MHCSFVIYVLKIRMKSRNMERPGQVERDKSEAQDKGSSSLLAPCSFLVNSGF